MKKIFIVCVSCLLLAAACDNGTAPQQQAPSPMQTQTHSSPTTSPTTGAVPSRVSLSLQEQCAKDAKAFFDDDGWKNPYYLSTGVDYANHFSKKYNKCFIRITSASDTALSTNVNDVHDGMNYAEVVVSLSNPELINDCWVFTGLNFHDKTFCISGSTNTNPDYARFKSLVDYYYMNN
jgi:hypothetical protein